VEGMLAQMPAALLAEWMAFDQVEPISLGYRGDVGTGIVASLIANVYRDPKKRQEAYEASDFMPKYGPNSPAPFPEREVGEEPAPEEVWAKVRIWAGRYKK